MTFAIALIVNSALDKDSEILNYLRSTYRERWRNARMGRY